ncbi:helix-turn-helix domain-containing protein [Halobacillus sp. A5]|uniref:helix-turn-helix domain-containing protein n=1 Tax=Halobacillus sp. A5 TaxID=2880263 RepID=UPI0020A6B370|nr:helix-turn-helix domain-containing protein [Halobacillus sp. A5]MCP3028791.1 helix-turn-helix domain-containing protein [Halobacillus sp. A5]
MFEAKLQPEAEFNNKVYDIFYDIAKKAQEDVHKENELPYLLDRTKLAEYVFNVSVQSLDAHILKRKDFPKVHVGGRTLYPKDLVIKWIREHVDVTSNIAPERNFGVI